MKKNLKNLNLNRLMRTQILKFECTKQGSPNAGLGIQTGPSLMQHKMG